MPGKQSISVQLIQSLLFLHFSLYNVDRSIDKVYRSVEAANIEQGNKYHVVGGAAGTVSPSKYTFCTLLTRNSRPSMIS